jgi:hypothetical protein
VARLLSDTLQWPVPKDSSATDIAYHYTPDEVGAPGAPRLDKKVASGVVRLIVLPNFPSGFLLLAPSFWLLRFASFALLCGEHPSFRSRPENGGSPMVRVSDNER